jgi:prolyl oligopeptidase
MKRLFFFLLFLTLCELSAQKINVAPSQSVTENYYGINITDEFRNLENLKDSVVINWVKQEAKTADSTLKEIPNINYYLNKRLEIENRQGFSISNLKITSNDLYFYLKKKAGEKVPKVYYKKGFNGIENLLYDPSGFNPSIESTALSSEHDFVINLISPSWNGSKIAISLSEKGKEISSIIIVDVNTKNVYPQIISQTNSSSIGGIKWLEDNSGFFYVYYPIIDGRSNLFAKNTKTILYKIGTDPDDRKDVFSNSKNPNLKISPEKYPSILAFNSDDKYYIGILVDAEDYRQTFIIKKSDFLLGRNNWKPLYSKEDKITYIRISKNDLYFMSGKDSSNLKLCRTSLENPNFKDPEILIPEKENEVLNEYVVTKDGIYFTTIKNSVEAKLYLFKNNKEIPIQLPSTSGSIDLTSKGQSYPDIWVNCSGWTEENNRYRYVLKENKFVLENLSPVIDYPEFKNLVVQETSAKSYDGEEVPLTLIYSKNLKRDGNASTMIYGYGAYSYSITPFFSKGFLLWANQGGVFAIAHVRGGGEKGEKWHADGMKSKKPNSWKDLIACTEYLIQNKFSSPENIAVWGQSAGGVLVGRAVTERPDLFKAVILESGNLNTLRSKLNGVGGTSVDEYGDIDKPEEFKWLLEMDAYQHIVKGVKYPSALIITGMNDTRVAPWQSMKFAAKLKKFSNSGNPVLLKINKNLGHGIEDPVYKVYEKDSSILAFAFWQLGNVNYQPQANSKK